MACGMYRRVRLDMSPLKMYGFQKVTHEELHDITSRIVKPTYNREVYLADRMRLAPPRTPSAVCKKNQGDAVVQSRGRRRLPQPAVDKIFKRMRTPTLSVLAAQGELEPSYEFLLLQEKSRPKSASTTTSEEKDKEESRLSYSRPTTASKGKRFCQFCTDPTMQEYMEIDYSDDKAVEEEELSEIVQRLTTPTMASRLAAGQPKIERCPRRKPSTSSVINGKQNKQLPLCGLSRSKSVHDITERLYSTPTHVIPTSAKKDRRQKLAATPCTM